MHLTFSHVRATILAVVAKDQTGRQDDRRPIMETVFREKDELASLGIVFFCNEFVRALDEFRSTQIRPDALGDLCDKAISWLYRLHCPDTDMVATSAGLTISADELATLATSLERHFSVSSAEQANSAVDRTLKSITRIKTQKDFTDDLKARLEDVLKLFDRLAEEGLASCRRQASGEPTDAERVWQHYAMNF
jgi:hypothetical protein